MDPEKVKTFYTQDGVVIHYATAVSRVGLWKSESMLFSRLFDRDHHLLELGCGAGRIAFGLHELGFHKVTAIDYAPEMIQVARAIAEDRNVSMDFQVGDATSLAFEDESFDGAIFGFNGMMQIPGEQRRQQALTEIMRVLRPGSLFFFTTHDRDNPKFRKHWAQDQMAWVTGTQREEYEEPGDRIGATDWGELYIHVPTRSEVETALRATGFLLVSCQHRASVANEPQYVRDFSDECLIWIAKKPGA
jgi:SAM-dependent methyltransferase